MAKAKDESTGKEFQLFDITFMPMARYQLAGGHMALLNTSKKCKGSLDESDSKMAAELYDKLKFSREEKRNFVIEVPGLSEQPRISALENADDLVLQLNTYQLRFLHDVMFKDKDVVWRPIDREWVEPLFSQIKAALHL